MKKLFVKKHNHTKKLINCYYTDIVTSLLNKNLYLNKDKNLYKKGSVLVYFYRYHNNFFLSFVSKLLKIKKKNKFNSLNNTNKLLIRLSKESIIFKVPGVQFFFK